MVKGINEKLFNEAKRYIPGGVNSPVRAFKAVGGTPVFIKKGKGSKIYDFEGNSYIDYCMSWGALILGHAYSEVIRKVKSVIENGTSFGAPTPLETEFAKLICDAFPSIEMLRVMNSGTEACMSAVRLARGYTGRKKIIKFAGCYHGHADYLLVQAGSGSTTFGIPSSLGLPDEYIKHTFVLSYNNLDVVEKVVKRYYKDIACIIVEPIPANMGVILPKPNFLKGLREISEYYNIVLIFDEVITGFRINYGGVEKLYNIKPDLTCLGKIIGGGFPIGGLGGKKEIMEFLSPVGSVYQAGTLSGNPVSITAGISTLKILKNKNIYKLLEEKTDILCSGIKEIAMKKDIHIVINKIGSMFTIFFTDEKDVYDYQKVLKSNTEQYRKFFHKMLKEGIYLPPSQFEANFVSLSHTEKDIEKTLKAIYDVFKNI
ncbi:MAG: glutamate-1-semialdehyde 2,1-aminomutase [Candidatus Omnitrophica bacterium]|nr:glutamate-1-semialdehyde 2,1-aminomutase [Candidatus Omnitrophota bacterium]MCM8802606.1 glutamate-1-semialdehyde 2,1-aminomutase [Candidatus Omnitrophota bacterium]